MKQQIQEKKENKMGTMPVNRLLLSMALPMMLSMLVQACYNIVDSLFLAKISEDAITAVSLAYPVQLLLIAFGGGLGVGVNALLSRSLGEKNFKEANRAAMNGIFICILGALVFIVFGVFFCESFFRVQTENEAIVKEATSYLSICTIFCAGLIFQMMFERLLQSTGKTVFSMISQLTGALVNIILDPIFIFGYLGAPKMGTAGAAVATVSGQCVAACIGLILNLKVNHEIHFQVKDLLPKAATIKKILVVGFPAMVMQAVGSVMNFGMNHILLGFSTTAAAVFGIYFKLNSFIFMPVFGLNNGMIPILSYNYGARNKPRMMKTIKLSLIYAVAIMTVGFGIFQVIPDKLLALFEASDNMLSIGVPALRWISTSFVFAAFSIILISCFQALGNGYYSLIISVCRQLLVLLPVAYLFSLTGKIHLVWLSFPIAEVMAISLSGFFFARIYKKKIKPLEEQV